MGVLEFFLFELFVDNWDLKEVQKFKELRDIQISKLSSSNVLSRCPMNVVRISMEPTEDGSTGEDMM